MSGGTFIVQKYHSSWMHSCSDGHPGCFLHLALVNEAAVNIGVHRFCCVSVSGFIG